MSTSAQQFTGPTQIHERRSHSRVLPKTLIYVACGESNGGMVLNVSHDGMAISMAIPVGDDSYSSLHVRMNGLAQSIEVHGRMAWTTKSKKRAGIQLIDVSDEQRGQIREWLAQEGVRDVNLLPRVSESASSVLPASAGAISGRLLDEPRPNLSPVAPSAPINPAVSTEPRASLLAGLGGTAPEFLGPAQDEPFFTEDTITATPSSLEPSPNRAVFREKEWDLASVTTVPRKRSKPEGLSALGLLLLWIAIPSFGIGIIVGRRPLQNWLSQGAAARKNISHLATPEPEIVSARDESPDINSSDIDATQSPAVGSVETPARASSHDVKTTAATKSFVSTPAVVDTKLLNSMSTQELRALKLPGFAAPPKNPNSSELSNVPTNPVNASAQRSHSKDKSAVTPSTAHDNQSIAGNNEAWRVQGFSRQNSKDQVARTISVDSSVSAATTNHQGGAPSNSSASHPSLSTVTPTPAPRGASSSTAMVPTAPAPDNGTAHQNSAGSAPSILAVGNAPAPSPNHSVSPDSATAGNSAPASSQINDASRNNNIVSNPSKTESALPFSPGTTPSAPAPSRSVARIAPDTTSRMASSPSRPVAPSGATNLAPVNAQAPFHGVMLVARKNNESFLLKLPVEAAGGGRSVSVQLQRFVMVPAESRWHHHGPIAKLAIGELLTQVTTLETASAARVADVVTVRAFVDKNGSVQDLKPVSGRFALMPRVMHDVREWQFDQTLIDGKPVESEVIITVEFRSGSQPSRSRDIQAQNSFKP